MDVPLWALRLLAPDILAALRLLDRLAALPLVRNPRLGEIVKGGEAYFLQNQHAETREGLEKVLPGIRALAEMIYELPQKDRMAVEAYLTDDRLPRGGAAALARFTKRAVGRKVLPRE